MTPYSPVTRPIPCHALAVMGLLIMAGCATVQPGGGLPKTSSTAFQPSADTVLGKAFVPLAKAHDGDSGFRILSAGVDGLTARVEMIDAARRSVDILSYIFRADRSGNLIVQALLRAADRGVRIRVIVDDAETVPGDERILSLAAKAGIEVRIFNPLRYRGHIRAIRGAEFLFDEGRLDYRMHDKLMVSDNTSAIIGGRNIGDQYFQIDPESQFGDDDVVVIGPTVQRLSNVFDEFWNGTFAVPAKLADKRHTSEKALSKYLAELAKKPATVAAELKNSPAGAPKTPFDDILSGRTPLIWSRAQLTYDSPDKKDVDHGDAPGRLIYKAVAEQANMVGKEFLMVTPYFIPSQDELRILKAQRERHAKVRILTNSLIAAPNESAHSGYMHYRVQLLQDGVELHEIRAMLGSARGSGQTKAISRHGNYGLHAKIFVFDRQTLFVGSMNYDQRSKHLNTEIGLLIASPELARETAIRFEALTQLDNAYSVSLKEGTAGAPRLVWTTEEGGQIVRTEKEPARSVWQRLQVKFLALLPLDSEL